MPLLTIPLRGPAGEPVDFARTMNSHGVASLPPISPDGDPATSFRATLRLADGRIETVIVSSEDPATLTIETAGDHGPDGGAAVVAAVRHILRLDQDLTPFYAKAAADPDLAWVAAGAGRMMRCQTVFEDVVKTICTTNCTWSGTVRMVEGIVRHLGELAPGAPEDTLPYRAFPTPAAMAEADPRLYKDLARCGYRGAYLQSLARKVVDGEIDLEAMGTATPDELPDDELAKRLVALPGVGSYAAAHVLTMLGRFSRLVLDSWTRPTYAKLVGRDAVPDAEIRERFAGFGEHAGLAFWMVITRGWVDVVADPAIPPDDAEEAQPDQG
jgi:N-glycosylase/DNA lyase